MNVNLIPIKKENLEKVGIFISPVTLYKWHSIGKYSDIYCKIGRRLFLNIDAFKKRFIEKSEEVGHEEKF